MAVTLHAHTMSAVLSGNRGAVGVGIADIMFNDDYTMTITLTDGSTYTSDNLRGEQGIPGIDAEYDGEELVITTGDHTETDGGEVSTIRVKGEARVIRDRVTEEMACSAYPTETVTGDIVSITDGAEDIPVKTLTVAVEPKQAGSGDPSPDNVRTITGWDAVNVVRTGKNIWDEVWELGNIGTNGNNVTATDRIRSTNYIPCKPSTQYYLYGSVNTRFYDHSKQIISYESVTNRTFTTPANCYYIRFACPVNYGTTYNHDISINYPSTDTSYHAYSGTTYTIPLSSTVYGGTLDVTGGTVTVTHAYVNLDGSESWEYYSVTQGNLFRVTRNDKFAVVDQTNTWCSAYKATAERANNTVSGSGKYLDIVDNRYSTVADFKAALTASNVQVVYPIATPQTITLDPTTISTLLGSNTIYADAGQATVCYRADVGLYIDGKITAVMAAIAELS